MALVNWKRGLFRLWIVATAIWIPWAFYASAVQRVIEVNSDVEGLTLLFAPPLVVPALVAIAFYATRWIIRGFRL